MIRSTVCAALLLAATANAAETRLIPRDALFGNPTRTQGQISPDGKYLSWLASVNGVLNVWVAPIDKPGLGQAVTNDTARGIRSYAWTYDGKHLVYSQDKNGDEKFHVYSVDVTDRSAHDLTPFDGAHANIAGASRVIRDEILVTINKRDPKFPDLYRVNLTTGALKLVAENPGFDRFITDARFDPRIAVRNLPSSAREVLRKKPDGSWVPFLSFAPEDVNESDLVGLNQIGDALLLRDTRGRDTAALTRVDLHTGAEEILAEDPRLDIGTVMLDDTTGEAIAYALDEGKKVWKAIDARYQPDFEFLAKQDLGNWKPVARTDDGRRWMIESSSDLKPGTTYLYDQSRKKLTRLFDTRRQLTGAPLARMHPVVIKSRDGLDLVSYLTLPKGSDTRKAGTPDKPVPLVVYVHGGPWGRDTFGYSPARQWLANRGYAVLSVNYRGSTGFGKSFLTAGDRQWMRTMQDDLNDAAAWAVQSKIADPAKLAIMGASYGGFATLAGVTRDPDLWACGVDTVGPSNLETLVKSISPLLESLRAQIHRMLGDPNTEEGRAALKAASPLYLAGQIKKPLLIGQGANDPRVAKAEADQMVQAMKAHGIPVTYVLYPDEGHGFVRPPNKTSFNAVAEGFLKRCLGGRAEPITAATLQGSTMQVLEGGALIDGLDAAMR